LKQYGVNGEIMEYAKLGTSELNISTVGLGCNNFGMRLFDQEQVNTIVNTALDAGINFFDTADMYGNGMSEQMLGKALGSRRSEVIVGTKFGMKMDDDDNKQGASRRYILEAVEASLTRLGSDYIDLYQVHFPDPETPISETLETLNELVTAGKVRFIGNSNFTGDMVTEAEKAAEANGTVKFVSAQNHYNLITRGIEEDVTSAASAIGLGVIPYFPLASGFLTGKYQPGVAPPEDSRMTAWGMADSTLTDENFSILGKLEAFAKKRNHTVLDLAMGWLLSHSYVPSVISGATKPNHVISNVEAASWQLNAEEMDEVNALTS
jgi:aryl-alcohol dehydrogenase-like predicted oxidoreductase